MGVYIVNTCTVLNIGVNSMLIDDFATVNGNHKTLQKPIITFKYRLLHTTVIEEVFHKNI